MVEAVKPTREERQLRAGVYRLRLERNLARLAVREGLDPERLKLLAERLQWLCAVCLDAFVNPRVYRVGETPRGIICTTCASAVQKATTHPESFVLGLRAHKRFDPRYLERRARMRRVLDFAQARGPFDEGFE